MDNFTGHGSGSEHRTTGERAWCHECREWCYPDEPCGQKKCCSLVRVDPDCACEALGRQQMIDALREIADNPASVWELIRRKIPGQFADGTEHRAVTRAIHLVADYLESIAKDVQDGCRGKKEMAVE